MSAGFRAAAAVLPESSRESGEPVPHRKRCATPGRRSTLRLRARNQVQGNSRRGFRGVRANHVDRRIGQFVTQFRVQCLIEIRRAPMVPPDFPSGIACREMPSDSARRCAIASSFCAASVSSACATAFPASAEAATTGNTLGEDIVGGNGCLGIERSPIRAAECRRICRPSSVAASFAGSARTAATAGGQCRCAAIVTSGRTVAAFSRLPATGIRPTAADRYPR